MTALAWGNNFNFCQVVKRFALFRCMNFDWGFEAASKRQNPFLSKRQKLRKANKANLVQKGCFVLFAVSSRTCSKESKSSISKKVFQLRGTMSFSFVFMHSNWFMQHIHSDYSHRWHHVASMCSCSLIAIDLIIHIKIKSISFRKFLAQSDVFNDYEHAKHEFHI